MIFLGNQLIWKLARQDAGSNSKWDLYCKRCRFEHREGAFIPPDQEVHLQFILGFKLASGATQGTTKNITFFYMDL